MLHNQSCGIFRRHTRKLPIGGLDSSVGQQNHFLNHVSRTSGLRVIRYPRKGEGESVVILWLFLVSSRDMEGCGGRWCQEKRGSW